MSAEDEWTETLHLPVKVKLSKGPRGWMAEDLDGNVALGKDRTGVIAKLSLQRAIREEYKLQRGISNEQREALEWYMVAAHRLNAADPNSHEYGRASWQLRNDRGGRARRALAK